MQYSAEYAMSSPKHTTAALLTACGKQDHLYVRYVCIDSMGKSVSQRPARITPLISLE